MSPVSLLFLLSVIISSKIQQCEAIDCHNSANCACTAAENCVLSCTGWHSCDDALLNCRSGYPCNIMCGTQDESCDNAQIYSNGATTLSVTCDGWFSCRDTSLNCGTSDCSVTCSNSQVCDGLTVNLNYTSTYAFECTGACPSTVPAPFGPTLNPTTVPTVAPSQPTTQPTTSNPTTSIPTTNNPTTSVPTTSNPTSLQPTSIAPTTNNPTSMAPTTNSPTSANNPIPTTTSDFTIVISADDINKLDADEITGIVLLAIQDSDVVLVSSTINGDSIVIEVNGNVDLDKDNIENDIEHALENKYDNDFTVDIESEKKIAKHKDNNKQTVVILFVSVGILLVCICILSYLFLRKNKKRTRKRTVTLDNMIMEAEHEGNIVSTTGVESYGNATNGISTDVKSISTDNGLTNDSGEVELMNVNHQDNDEYDDGELYGSGNTVGKTVGGADNDDIIENGATDDGDSTDDNENDEIYNNNSIKKVITAGDNDIENEENDNVEDEMYDDLNRVQTPKNDEQVNDDNLLHESD